MQQSLQIQKMSERQTRGGNLANLLTWSLANLHSLIHSLWTCWTTFVFMSMLKSHSHSLTLSLSLFLTLTLSISHSITLDMLNNFCFHLYAPKSLSHISLSLLSLLSLLSQLSMSHSITLDMLNNFCFHVYAQKSLFIAENCNVSFWTTSTSCQFNVHRAGSQLKIYQFLQQ